MTLDPRSNESHQQISTEGGSVVQGNVSVADEVAVGRDKNIFQTFFGSPAEVDALVGSTRVRSLVFDLNWDLEESRLSLLYELSTYAWADAKK